MQRPQHEADVPVVHTNASGKPVTAAEGAFAATTPTAVLPSGAAVAAPSSPTATPLASAGAAAQQQQQQGQQQPEGTGSGIKHALTGLAEKIGLKVRRGEDEQEAEKRVSDDEEKLFLFLATRGKICPG